MTKIIWKHLEPHEIVEKGDYFRSMKVGYENLESTANHTGKEVKTLMIGSWEVVRPVSLIFDDSPNVRSDSEERHLDPHL